MNPIQVTAAFAAGLIVGAGAVYLTFGSTPGPAAVVALDVPAEAEASAAMAELKKTSYPKSTVRLGQCDKDTAAPGVRCTVEWNRNFTGSQPISAVVGFSKGADGQWVAVQYF